MATGSRATWIGARPPPGATALLVVVVAAFVTYVFLKDTSAQEWVARHLVLSPRRAIGPEPWQLFTTGLIHLHGRDIFSSAVGIWFFATAVEQWAGRRRMLLVFGAAQLAGTLVTALVGRATRPDALLDGCEAGVIGLLAAFGVHYSAVRMHFFGLVEMRGRTIALVFLGIAFFIALLNGQLEFAFGWTVAAGVGWAIAGGGGDGIALALDRLRLWRLRRRYKVIPGGKDKKYVN